MTEQRVRRRFAAILAADIAEYSRLMGQDEHDPGLIGSKSNALLKSLRGDLRWQAFLEKMGLEN